MFSGQLDTTQDITAKYQCSVVLRYVTGVIHERFVAIVECEASPGQYFLQLLKDILQKVNLDMYCISSMTDDAANMQGQYK